MKIFKPTRPTLRVHITEQEIADARENVVKFPTHVEYVAYRFLKEHNVKVINHKALRCLMAPNEKMFMYEGEIGVSLTARMS